MSTGERQDWSASTTAVAGPPPKGVPASVAALRSAFSPDSPVAAAAQLDMIWRAVPSAQQAELLALASRLLLVDEYASRGFIQDVHTSHTALGMLRSAARAA